MKKLNLFPIIIFAIALVSCTKKEAAKVETKETKPIVKTALVEMRKVAQSSDFTATVQADVKNNIAPSTPGRIRKIFVEVGTSVTKGQKLAQMDNANLSNTEVQIENMRRIYKRVSGLFAVGGASQQELDNAKLQLDMAETNMKNLSENTFLLSPINGIITAQNYDEGDMYSGQMPIMTVMQISPVQLKIDVSESFYSKVKMGMPVDVKIEVFGDDTFKGKVSLIYPTIDERTRTFGVEVKIANGNGKVRPGMFARVNFDFGEMNRVVVADQSIVKQSGSGARFVYVYNNGKVEFRQVEIGRRLGNEFEIISGLNTGEQIVIAGQSKLIDGGEAQLAK